MANKKRKETGEATARIHLIDGKVLVKNAKGKLLLEGEASVGFWNSLWSLMENKLDVSYRVTKADFNGPREHIAANTDSG